MFSSRLLRIASSSDGSSNDVTNATTSECVVSGGPVDGNVEINGTANAVDNLCD